MSTILQKYFRGGGGRVGAAARANGARDAPRTRWNFSAQKQKCVFLRKKLRFAFARRDARAPRRGARDGARRCRNGG